MKLGRLEMTAMGWNDWKRYLRRRRIGMERDIDLFKVSIDYMEKGIYGLTVTVLGFSVWVGAWLSDTSDKVA